MNLTEWLVMYVCVASILNGLWYLAVLAGYEPKRPTQLSTSIAVIGNFGLAALAAFVMSSTL